MISNFSQALKHTQIFNRKSAEPDAIPLAQAIATVADAPEQINPIPELRDRPSHPELLDPVAPENRDRPPHPDHPTDAPPREPNEANPELRDRPPHPESPDPVSGELPRPDQSNPPDQNREGSPPSPPLEGEMPSVWVYLGEAYDLSEFINKHPGGAFFIGRMRNRDITALVNIFHPNSEKVKKMLKKYALGRKARPEDVHPKYNAPAFLFRENFDGWRDTPKYNFQEGQLLNHIKARLKDPEMKQKVARMDLLFDVITVLFIVAYVIVQVLRLSVPQSMPIALFAPLMAMIRISISGAGHYLIHRPQVSWNKLFSNIFDINYVPMAFVVTDGHTLMHHPFTQSEVDIKRNVFTAMLELPRYYRIPIHTLHKLGHVCVGMFVRSFEICALGFRFGVKDMYGSWQRGLPHYIGLIAMRILLLGELIVFALHGDIGAWFAQFVITLWISTFMIVASHDFEETEVDRGDSQDWAVLQIKNAYDLTMIGNPYVDCFLSAGLSPHRVHHVLPYQRSGFANIVSEDIVREEAEKFDVEWLTPKNFFVDRLPVLAQHYLFVPSRWAEETHSGLLKEHLHPQAFKATANYIAKGFMGIGSI